MDRGASPAWKRCLDRLSFNLPLRTNVDILLAEEHCRFSARQYKDLIRFFVALLEVSAEQYGDKGFMCVDAVFVRIVVLFAFSQYHVVAAMENGEEMRSARDILSNALFCKFDLAVLNAPLFTSPVCQNDHLMHIFWISSNHTPKTDHCCVFLYYIA
jgi:hypothetical protein